MVVKMHMHGYTWPDGREYGLYIDDVELIHDTGYMEDYPNEFVLDNIDYSNGDFCFLEITNDYDEPLRDVEEPIMAPSSRYLEGADDDGWDFESDDDGNYSLCYDIADGVFSSFDEFRKFAIGKVLSEG